MIEMLVKRFIMLPTIAGHAPVSQKPPEPVVPFITVPRTSSIMLSGWPLADILVPKVFAGTM